MRVVRISYSMLTIQLIGMRGEMRLYRAIKEDKPIFISIGYSACHWCHVMAHESFEDEGIARLMNEKFINIKVDREERPDLDDIYQRVAQLQLEMEVGLYQYF